MLQKLVPLERASRAHRACARQPREHASGQRCSPPFEPCTLHPEPCTLNPEPCSLNPEPCTPKPLERENRAPRACARQPREHASGRRCSPRARCSPPPAPLPALPAIHLKDLIPVSIHHKYDSPQGIGAISLPPDGMASIPYGNRIHVEYSSG